MIRKAIIAVAAVFILCSSAHAVDDTPEIPLTGKVLDQLKRPVPHALVVVRDRDTGVERHARTDSHGCYEIIHTPAARCTVHVIPPVKSGLAQASLSDVPALEERHFVISVHKGFVVSGQIESAGRPVKGATIRVQADEGDTVHDGGETATDGRGRFAMVLTPGIKVLEIGQTTQMNTAASFKHELSVAGDIAGVDINVPKSVAAGLGR